MELQIISKIEQILDELSKSKEENLDVLIEHLLKAICEYLHISLSENPLSSLFGTKTNLRQKKFIAACMLRALYRKPDIFGGIQGLKLREKVCSLFDETLPEIYKNNSISLKTSYDIKLSTLQEIELKLINNFSTLSESINSLQKCKGINLKFMQLLFQDAANSFIASNFIDNSIISKEKISALFRLLDSYMEAQSVNLAIDAHTKINHEYESFLCLIEQSSSQLSEICIGQVFRKILRIIEEDFKSRDEIVETEVSAKILEKKYPFHIDNRELSIKVSVVNEEIGKAFDVEINVSYDHTYLNIFNPFIKIGDLEPREKGDFIFEAITLKGSDNKGAEIIVGEVSWSNYAGERRSRGFEGELLPQSPNLDWQELSEKTPYNLEAVVNESELVGRGELIKDIYRKLTSEQIESSIIYGQKRVGKTSIAITIKNKLKEKANYTAIYMSVGKLDKNSPEKFLSSLGEFILEEISFDPSFSNYKLPEISFEGSITPLDKLFRYIKRQNSNHKFVIMIDEFDEIPSELYKLTDIGDNFFHNIRSLSSEGNIGFVLIGGENMKLINQNTDKLNKFKSFSVDYFDREKYWNDFRELICRPVKEDIEFTDDAIVELYQTTEGNPFFTKLICAVIYAHACETRNAYISSDEVVKAINECLNSTGTNNVNHFWKDGIPQTNATERDQIETNRRKFLLSYANIVRSSQKVFKDNLSRHGALDISLTAKFLESFTSRKIFVETDGIYRCKPKFFNDWLIGSGFYKITSEYLDEQAIEEFQNLDSKAYVIESEIHRLCESWKRFRYRGAEINTTDVRVWLDQFGNNIEKRLMYTLLTNLRFYSESLVRNKLNIIHDHVKKGLVRDIKQVKSKFEKKDRNILLSAFGKPSKSGSTYLRLYATENDIYRDGDNITDFEKISNVLQNNERINALVFIEDFFGTGGSVIDGLKQLNEACGELISERKIKVVVSAICGLSEGIEAIQSETEKFLFKPEVFVCDHLTEKDKCFSSQSNIFDSDINRNQARQIAYDYGYKLVEKMPLGYKDNQLLITFHESCPNNSLPILWADKPNWKALFKRQ